MQIIEDMVRIRKRKEKTRKSKLIKEEETISPNLDDFNFGRILPRKKLYLVHDLEKKLLAYS